MLSLKSRRSRSQSRAARADNCPPCDTCNKFENTLNLSVRPWTYGTTKNDPVMTCGQILIEVLSTSHYSSTADTGRYIAYGRAEPNKWLSIGGIIELKSGFFKGRLALEDILIVKTDASGDWHLTMYEAFRQGLIYADNVIRKRDPGGKEGIIQLLRYDWEGDTPHPDLDPNAFKTEVIDWTFDFVQNDFIKQNNYNDLSNIERYLCKPVGAALALLFGNLFGNPVASGWSFNPGGHIDVNLCFIVKEYNENPKINTTATNFIGSGKSCLTARFPVPDGGPVEYSNTKSSNAFVNVVRALLGLD